MADLPVSSGDTINSTYSEGSVIGRTSDDREREYYSDSDSVADKENNTGFLGAAGNLKDMTWINANTYDPDEYLFGKNGIRILGMPMFYSPLDDPNNRVYKETFEGDLPVIYIVPGKPIMNRKLTGNNSIWDKAVELSDSALGILSNTISLFNIKNYNDLRFISFRANMADYFRYLEVILSYLHAAMDIGITFKLKDWYKNSSGDYGIAFFLDKSTSISDSANNGYGPSTLANEANQKAVQIREYKQFLGMGSNGGLLSKIASGVTEIISSMIESVPVIGGLVGSFGKTLNGAQLYYPDIWQSSTFSRSYTLSFKFYSPYGDPTSIFKYLYVPTMALMCLALPPMDGIYSYKQPFLVRLSCPGRFECECGAITSFDMRRSENFLWTTEGFPNEINISMNVQDLYPNLIIPKTIHDMRYNAGLASFLECMAGIRFDQIDVIGRVKRKLKTSYNRLGEVMRFFDNKIEDAKYNIGQSVLNNFLR